jgi:DNA-binding transcriptional regulator GbsR (MarR family)
VSWEAGRQEFVAAASTELAAQGFPAMPARVLMALTASDDGRLTAEELTGILGVSAAAVSGAIRYLILLGFVRQTTVPGSRRHLYLLPESSPWYTSTLTRSSIYTHTTAILERGVELIPEDSPARARIAEMAGFFRFLERRMPLLLDEWLAERDGLAGR